MHALDTHFLDRMDNATAEEQDAVFADLAARSLAGDELATRTIRVLLQPACRRISASDAVVDVAYEEVMDWAVREGHVTR